jgi:transcriptional regulator with XRE-family HTH domain
MNAHLIALGRAVRELRTEKNLSAGELAAAARLTLRRLGGIEAGRVDPTLDTVLAIAEGLGVRPFVLVGRADARHALEAYAGQWDEHAGSTALVAELSPLVEAAKAAGMSEDAIAAILDGVQAYEQLLHDAGEEA